MDKLNYSLNMFCFVLFSGTITTTRRYFLSNFFWSNHSIIYWDPSYSFALFSLSL